MILFRYVLLVLLDYYIVKILLYNKNYEDPPQTVEEFVKLNTEEQGPGKFHCPLSGKKFKGSEFVRKHIFNKHAEKVEGVKKDVS